jgi:hypothetical protein
MASHNFDLTMMTFLNQLLIELAFHPFTKRISSSIPIPRRSECSGSPSTERGEKGEHRPTYKMQLNGPDLHNPVFPKSIANPDSSP